MSDEFIILVYTTSVFILTSLCAAYIIRNDHFSLDHVKEILILFAGIVVVSFGMIFLIGFIFELI